MESRNIFPPGADGGRRLSPDDIRRRLAAGLSPEGRGDLIMEARLDGGQMPGRAVLDRAPTPAAVLVPLVHRDEGMTVLLTQRTAHLAHHPGQVSFPGGRLEDCDGNDAVTCALRETEEEIGLPPAHVTVLGRLDDYVTATGFHVTPVVGLVRPPFDLLPDPFEVAEVFEVPLPFLLDGGNHVLHRREIDGRSRPFWQMVWQERVIWGATAGILVNLSDVLGRP